MHGLLARSIQKRNWSYIVVLPVSIGGMKNGNALIALGTSVNIIPLLVVERIRYL